MTGAGPPGPARGGAGVGTGGAGRVGLSEAECRALVGGTSRGHLGFTRDALPAIAPVRYAVDGDRVVIAARPDSDHLPPAGGAVVVLGVDDFDGEAGWAVTIVGPARTVTDPAGVAALDLLLSPAAGRPPCYVVLRAGVVRGWREAPAAEQRHPA